MATAGVSLLERRKRYQEAIDRLHQLLGAPLLLLWGGCGGCKESGLHAAQGAHRFQLVITSAATCARPHAGGCCCLARRGDWWTRLATNLGHLKRKTQALEQVEAALADEWLSRGDRLGLQRRWLRLGAGRARGWAVSALGSGCWHPCVWGAPYLIRAAFGTQPFCSQGACWHGRRATPLARAALGQSRQLGAAGGSHRGPPPEQRDWCAGWLPGARACMLQLCTGGDTVPRCAAQRCGLRSSTPATLW